MPDIKLNLPDSNNWESIYTGSQVATHNPNIPNHIHTPIPELSIPILVDKFVLAILCTSNTAQPRWRFAGFLSQRINTGLTVGGNYDTDATVARKIYLDRIQLIVFPEVASNYALAFKCPFLDRRFYTEHLEVYRGHKINIGTKNRYLAVEVKLRYLYAVYTAKEVGYLIDLTFKHLSEIVLLLMNAWQMSKLISMDSKREKARNQLAKKIQENREAIKGYNEIYSSPDDLPPSMRIDP
ncbi:MAG: hypothetical protein WBB28_24930 [Crinalium sp.]